MKAWRLICFLLAAVSPAVASAQSAAPVSFAGQRITILIGFSAIGGIGYDTYGRLMARYLGKHLPGGPEVVPENKPGAGSMSLANYLYSAAPKDGTEIALVGRGVAMDPLLKGAATTARFDATRFYWLGSMNNEVAGFFVSDKSPDQTLADVLQGRPMVVGTTGPGGDPQLFATTLNALFATRLKMISGYPGMNEILLAMESGEIDGVVGYSWGSARTGSADQLKRGKLKLLLQLALKKHPDLPEVPLVTDLVKDPKDRAVLRLIFSRQSMGRPFAAPPGLDPAVAAALRQGFADAMHDPHLLADAKTMGLELDFVSGEEVQSLVSEIYAASPEIVANARKIATATN